jgi:hypothetical protein
MRSIWRVGLVLMVVCGAITFASHAETTEIRGDYVEVRTASVFAGACHYNGELTTAGREALMAWNLTSGRWQGVDLAGVRAMAIVTADANLANNDAGRRSELIVDSSASAAQATAFAEALRDRYVQSLGRIVAVRRLPVSFQHQGKTYAVNAGQEAVIKIESMPNDLCCKMPNLVWYSPLVSLSNRKVGYTLDASYAGGILGDAWERSGENSAFYGTASF